ncbi:MAG: META domain-containing protein [Hyphomicrobiales bacterium]|nr:META domain-containing protein [Hyphomicrobiales bacterium]
MTVITARRKWLHRLLLALLLTPGFVAVPAAAQTFPYDQEMLLDVKPLPGSRRVPMLEVHADGKAMLDLWCHSVAAEVAVNGNEVRFNFLSAKPENCTPERIELDQAMAKALLEVTGWRRRNDIVEFVGPTSFRFRISTH